MNEGIDPKLRAEWNEKIGLPEEVVPIPRATLKPKASTTSLEEIFDRRVIDINDPKTKIIYKQFKSLPTQTRADILVDIKKNLSSGMSKKEAFERFQVLIAKIKEFKKLRIYRSDKYYKPEPPQKEY